MIIARLQMNLTDFHFGQRVVNLHLGDKVVEAREIILPLPPSKNKLHEVNYVGVKEVFSHQFSNSRKTKRGVIKTSTEYNTHYYGRRFSKVLPKLNSLTELEPISRLKKSGIFFFPFSTADKKLS